MVVQANYDDNPWFPEVLEPERRMAEGAEDYGHIWLGEYEKVGAAQFIRRCIVRDAMTAEVATQRQDELCWR